MYMSRMWTRYINVLLREERGAFLLQMISHTMNGKQALRM